MGFNKINLQNSYKHVVPMGLNCIKISQLFNIEFNFYIYLKRYLLKEVFNYKLQRSIKFIANQLLVIKKAPAERNIHS